MEISHQDTKNLYKALFALLIVLSVYFGIKVLSEFRSYGRISSQNVNTISFTGHGEITAVPDIANIYFSIRKEAKTVKDAQAAVAVVEKIALDFLKSNGVAEKDIKTSNASFNPKYDYKYDDTATVMPCTMYGCPPRPGKSVITGYEAYESITVKVRNTDEVGKIMQGLGTTGVSDLSGPNFAIDDEDALKGQARKKAISEAKAKAEVLAKDLGIRLGRIASFNESGNYPIYYAKAGMMSADSASAPAPAEIPKGENTISSDVTITYEIR
ncbi:hypothetical protein A3A01_02520 [Candidatus Nomurabacteria bacterium RIFCSPLOWO2_01_FULL_39_17]|uniref:26 kDa periplasmic immunogenic protein n=1 Tax=Candidatus Nomurabacteria bacterium RIFCSPLOWO2_01_FULL_39_17 TaxID=1801770 RepID=A0A1F6WWA7_9BACT|nr:MAG: hypothetical protein A3A01_02520 [Candidatus Nomurabacteria bacterium RIFCSPLOWO2_01_FULL_39_17]